MQGGEVDLNAITSEGHDPGASVEGGPQLAAFAEAMITGTADDVVATRAALVERVGEAGFVRAACVVGNFQRMVRIADATGIPLDGFVMAMTDDFREELGIDDFDGAANTAELGVVGRLGGKLLRRVSKPMLSVMPKIARRFAPSRDDA